MAEGRWRGFVGGLAGLLLGLPAAHPAAATEAAEATATAAADAKVAEASEGDAGPLTICFNWSCLSQMRLSLPDDEWQAATALLAEAEGPAHERALLAVAVGRLYAALARRTPIAGDRAGNTLDAGSDGRMDCIDHAITTTQLLRGLEARGGLRFHRVVAVQRRTAYVFVQHLAAAVEARSGRLLAAAGGALGAMPPEVYVVDSWFADPGEPAVVLPLAAWMEGEGPNVE